MTDPPQKWLLATPKTASSPFAPKFDGSTNSNGHYLLMSKASQGLTSRAEIALNYGNPSMYLKTAYQTCVMTFDYFIQSNNSDYSVDVRIGADSTNWNIIYRIAKVPTDGWRKAYAHIGVQFTPFMADLKGYLADSVNGAVAVDNVDFRNCSWPKPLDPKKKCTSNEFFCSQRKFCIDKNSVCGNCHNF